MTIEEMRQKKKEYGYTNQSIAAKSGVPLGTVQKIFAGTTETPREDTLKALENMFLQEMARQNAIYKAVKSEGILVKESQAEYVTKKQTTGYTLEDYLKLPDDQRVELIDGEFYDMAAPTTIHQAIAGYIHKIFLDFVLQRKGPCFPFISPVDVQLDKDNRTVVQPDVMIICDRDKYKNGRIFGAPDFVLEVLSPSTKKKDMMLKLTKYEAAGVKEYWMVDPEKKRIVQYDLSNLDIPVVYTFEDTVPVLVWNGECQVNFKEMEEVIAFLWER